ncbi:MAG: phosphatase PAP2 family protein [Myxococcaceae bacterium]
MKIQTWMLLFTVLCGANASAQEMLPPADAPTIESAPATKPEESTFSAGTPTRPESQKVRGVFLSDEYRYPRFGVLGGFVLRTLMNVVSIPSGIPSWTGGDFIAAGSVLALTAALSVSVRGPSIDVRIQNTFAHYLDGVDHPVIWSPYGDFLIWSSIWGMTAGVLVYGLAAEEARYIETAALMLEAFATTQILHLGLKLLSGRQGPNDGTGQGHYGGPAAFFKYFPSGTPSGHVATMVALFSTLMNYWPNPVLNVALATVAFVFSATIISDNYHYASDVLFGAALGYCVGRWVVHHRSTRFQNGEDGKVHEWKDSLVIAPSIPQGGGIGLGASLSF